VTNSFCAFDANPASTAIHEYSAVDNAANVLGRRSGSCLRSAITLLVTLALPFQTIASCDTDPTDCIPLPGIEVFGTPIDQPQWVPSGIPFFNDPGFDTGNYIPDGYWEGPRVECSAWLALNEPPEGCDADIKPPPVTASSPPCGPDGSSWSWLIPQDFRNSCIAHDVCYSQFAVDKNSCDSAFLVNMQNECLSAYLNFQSPISLPAYNSCMAHANSFYGGVQLSWALNRFDALREVAECRQWHERKENESNCAL
jgi:hypothetical protein